NRLIALGDMPGGSAHEINNPLSIIRAASGNLRMIIRNPDRNIVRLLDQIDDTVARAAKVFGPMRPPYRRGASEQPRATTDNPMTTVIQLVQSICDQKKIRFERACETLEFAGDAIQVSQMLHNILQNDVQAVEESSPHDHPFISLTIR